MNRAPFQVNSKRWNVERLPFASESGLQQFVEDNSKELLGVEVLGSARKAGGTMLKIDLLAVDSSGRVWIIECKHDLVDVSALRQVQRYRTNLAKNWDDVRKRLRARHAGLLQKEPDPLLVLIGYRYDQSYANEQALCLAYRYHKIQFTNEELQQQKRGQVSLYDVKDIVTPINRHPRVSKKIATCERLARLAPRLAKSFWKLDNELQSWGDVNVKYGGKNFVRYQTPAGKFAEAVIYQNAIQWKIVLNREEILKSDSDVPILRKALKEAHHRTDK